MRYYFTFFLIVLCASFTIAQNTSLLLRHIGPQDKSIDPVLIKIKGEKFDTTQLESLHAVEKKYLILIELNLQDFNRIERFIIDNAADTSNIQSYTYGFFYATSKMKKWVLTKNESLLLFNELVLFTSTEKNQLGKIEEIIRLLDRYK